MTPELRSKIREVLAEAYGWCTEEEAMMMAGIVLATRPALVVELGVFGGSSLLPLALAVKEVGSGQVIGIDPWDPTACTEGENDEANDDWWKAQDLAAIYLSCVGLIERYDLGSCCKLVAKKAEDAAADVPGPIDFLNLDGNHSELASCRDVEMWLPKVRRGGYVFFDDTNWPTTQKAFALAQKTCNVVFQGKDGEWAVLIKE